MRTANPVLSDKTFDLSQPIGGDEVMTIQGTVNKTGLLLVLTVVPAAWVWNQVATAEDPSAALKWIMAGAIGGLVLALITAFKKSWAMVTGPLYAMLEGLFLGGISAYYEQQFQGIVMQAVGLTFGTLAALLLAYKSGLIKATENFKLGVAAATGAIALVYLISMGMSFFGKTLPYLHDSGPIGIGISLFIVVIAALNLVLDFDFIERGAEQGAPKYMEWYAAFGLLVTLIWLYLEILRLLAKSRSR